MAIDRSLGFIALLSLLLCTAAGSATATATFSPRPLYSCVPVVATLTTGVKACWTAATQIVLNGTTNTISLDFDDSCPPGSLLLSRDYTLGVFAPGVYTLLVQSCTNNPPPFPSDCHTVLRQSFTVNIPPAPTLSTWMMILLGIALVALTGFKRTRAARH